MPAIKRSKPQTAKAIDPSKYYPIETFKADAGVGRTTIKRASLAGIELPTEIIGRRKYVDGQRGIEFLKAVAAMPKATA